jgi:tetratricopeptide (TPR) repeat protein
MPQGPPSRVERRLSAILAADVAGYSRLMHSDEEATHARLTALLVEAIHPAIAEHGGHIVKNTGDGFLAEFPSAVEAVRAAVQFQTRIHELTIDEAEDNRIAFRVGINIGRSAEIEGHIREAFRPSPRDVFAHHWAMQVGFAKMGLGADPEAVDWFHRSIEINRNYPVAYFALAAALALLGSLDQAKAAAKAGLTLVPSFTVYRYRDGASSDNPVYLALRERIYQGMRLAGIPEG